MSWKKYGGIDKYEKMNHIKANSIVTDTIVVAALEISPPN